VPLNELSNHSRRCRARPLAEKQTQLRAKLKGNAATGATSAYGHVGGVGGGGVGGVGGVVGVGCDVGGGVGSGTAAAAAAGVVAAKSKRSRPRRRAKPAPVYQNKTAMTRISSQELSVRHANLTTVQSYRTKTKTAVLQVGSIQLCFPFLSSSLLSSTHHFTLHLYVPYLAR
jgi:hypothetical protein